MADLRIPVFRNPPVAVLLLGILTCGLYLIYWNVKAAEVLNAVSGREAISPVIAVIAGCCWPANLYFFYMAGDCLEDVGKITGRPGLEDMQILLMILGFFVPVAAAMILQDHINRLYDHV